jgi:hypothetical protein
LAQALVDEPGWSESTAKSPGVAEGQPITGRLVATFTDDDACTAPSCFTATINWGDGSPTSAGTVTAVSAGSYSVSGSHTYIEDGTFTMTASLLDASNGAASATTSIGVSETTMTGQATSIGLNPEPGMVASSQPVAFFSDPGAEPTSNYQATIDWGTEAPALAP